MFDLRDFVGKRTFITLRGRSSSHEYSCSIELDLPGIGMRIFYGKIHENNMPEDYFGTIKDAYIYSHMFHGAPRYNLPLARSYEELMNTIKSRTLVEIQSTRRYSNHNGPLGNRMYVNLGCSVLHSDFDINPPSEWYSDLYKSMFTNLETLDYMAAKTTNTQFPVVMFPASDVDELIHDALWYARKHSPPIMSDGNIFFGCDVGSSAYSDFVTLIYEHDGKILKNIRWDW